jgi:hypothetical protein
VSDESRWITGATIDVDGGYALGTPQGAPSVRLSPRGDGTFTWAGVYERSLRNREGTSGAPSEEFRGRRGAL